MNAITISPKPRAGRKSAPTTTAVQLPTNLVRALDESLKAVGIEETVAEFLVSFTANILEDCSGFFESYIDEDTQDPDLVEAKLSKIRKKYGFSNIERIFSDKPELRPIYFPADAVKLLEGLLEVSGTGLKTYDYAREFLSSEITDSLNGIGNGVPNILAGSYQLEPEDFRDMQAFVDYWNSRKTIPA